MAQSANDLKIIHLRRLATPGKKYYGDDEKVYLGNSNGSLRLLDEALHTKFKATVLLDENNVQSAIEAVNSRLVQRTKQIEIDFGTLPYIKQKIFNIADSDAIAGDKITAVIAYEAPTGKSLDELEMDQISLQCSASTGSINILATSLGASLRGNFKVNYTINY